MAIGMRKVDARYIALAAPITACVAMVINIISLSTEYWIKSSFGEVASGHEGLWTSCVCFENVCACSSIFDVYINGTHEEVPSWFTATQASSCLGVIFNAGTTIILTASLAMYLTHKGGSYSRLVMMQRISYFLIILAMVWNAIASIVYGVKFDEENKNSSDPDLSRNLGWSWGLSILAAQVDLVALIMTWLVSYSPAK